MSEALETYICTCAIILLVKIRDICMYVMILLVLLTVRFRDELSVSDICMYVIILLVLLTVRFRDELSDRDICMYFMILLVLLTARFKRRAKHERHI